MFFFLDSKFEEVKKYLINNYNDIADNPLIKEEVLKFFVQSPDNQVEFSFQTENPPNIPLIKLQNQDPEENVPSNLFLQKFFIFIIF